MKRNNGNVASTPHPQCRGSSSAGQWNTPHTSNADFHGSKKDKMVEEVEEEEGEKGKLSVSIILNYRRHSPLWALSAIQECEQT